MAMSGEQFTQKLEKIDLDVYRSQLAFGCCRRTIYAWRSETAPVPRAVALLLLALEAGYIKPGWIMDKIKKDVV